MTNVASLLGRKPPNFVLSVAPTDTVQKILEMMRDHKVRSMVVLDDGVLTGIVSERDCALKVLLAGGDATRTLAREIMTPGVVTVTEQDSIDHCMQQMMSRNIRHLPVSRGGAVVGMVSVGDVVKDVLRQQEEHIRYLENYIRGHGVA
jgi:CBS domain-containing protein